MQRGVVIFLLICLMFVGSVEAYDPPPEIIVHSVFFDWSRLGGTPPCPAINIRENASTDVGTPEWWASYNGPAAYPKNASVKVRPSFYASDIDSCWIRATSSDFLGNLAGQKVEFFLGIPESSDGPYYFEADDNEDGVAKETVTWQWKVSDINGSGSSEVDFDSSGPHTIYVLLGNPQAPMSEPWTEVLDHSCDWADGNTTASGAVSDLTEELHTCGVTYDGGTHYTSGSYTNLDLTSLLDDLADPGSVEMDCRDFSNFLHVLTNSLGVSAQYTRIDRTTSPYWFTYNYLLPANWEHWDTDAWNYHQVGWYNSNVADAAADIDNDADPTQGPGDQNHVEKLVVGDMGLLDYIDKLTETPDVDSVATGTCTVY